MTPEAEKFNGWMAMIRFRRSFRCICHHRTNHSRYLLMKNENIFLRAQGRAAMIGFLVICGSYAFTGHIIPGIILMAKQTTKNNETDQVDFSIAEKWNGIAAIVGCVAAFASYILLWTTYTWFCIMIGL